MIIKLGLTGETSLQTEIKQGISFLLIEKRGAALITDENISLTLNKKSGGSEPLIPTSKLRRLAVMSQFGLGYQQHQKIADGDFKSAYMIRLTPDGSALTLDDDNFLSLNLSALVSGSTYNVYGFEAGMNGKVAFKQWARTISGADPQQNQFTCTVGSSAVFVSNNDAMESIRLFYKNGRQVTYTVPELSGLLRMTNDISFAADTLNTASNAVAQTIAGGGAELLKVDLRGVDSFIINTVGGVDLTVIQQSVVGY